MFEGWSERQTLLSAAAVAVASVMAWLGIRQRSDGNVTASDIEQLAVDQSRSGRRISDVADRLIQLEGRERRLAQRVTDLEEKIAYLEDLILHGRWRSDSG